jgi:peptide/nickel transport system substrate-binding protein
MTEIQVKLAEAAKLAGKGMVSRRDFMQLALAAGMTATAANAMFVKVVRAEPKKGGTLKIGLAQGATTDSLDPGLYYDQYTGTACWGTLSNSLTEVDAKGDAVPDLAESFEPSDGAKKWIFKLRKGVTFHNGKTVTADDVVASIKHHNIEGTKSAAKSLLAPVKSVSSDGPETVVYELNGGNADYPLHRVRLSHSDHAEEGRRDCRLVVRHSHWALCAREVRAGRHRQLPQERELLQK